MAWEKRRGTRALYYFRSIRKGRSVRKVYYGRSQLAHQAAQEDADRRASRAAERLALVDKISRSQPLATLTANLDGDTQVLVEAEMLAAGFHRQNYSRWRHRRGK